VKENILAKMGHLHFLLGKMGLDEMGHWQCKKKMGRALFVRRNGIR